MYRFETFFFFYKFINVFEVFNREMFDRYIIIFVVTVEHVDNTDTIIVLHINKGKEEWIESIRF